MPWLGTLITLYRETTQEFKRVIYNAGRYAEKPIVQNQ
jgi:hypothetical protein